MTKILAPLDFGDATEAVVDFAGHLGLALDATVELLHCHTVVDAPGYAQLRTEAESAIRQRLRGLAAEARAAMGYELRVLTQGERDHPAPGILAAAEGADLLVVGQTGSHGLWRFLLGDTTAQVIGGAEVATLVVPPGANYVAPQVIRLAVVGPPPAPGRATLAPLRRLAETTGARIEVTHFASDGAPTGREAFADALAGAAYGYRVVDEASDVAGVLTSSSGVLEDAWVCTVREERPGWMRALFRDLSERVAAEAAAPVLVLPRDPAEAAEVRRLRYAREVRVYDEGWAPAFTMGY